MVVNNLVFTSGQIPLDTEGNIVSDDVKEQTKQVLDNLSVVLEEAGSDLNSVVKATIFISDMNEFQQINEVYGSYFSEHQRRVVVLKLHDYRKTLKLKLKL